MCTDIRNGQVVTDLDSLSDAINSRNPDVIVVEGYNGVGKSKVLDFLTNKYHLTVYRPDYTSWANELPQPYRWTIFASLMSMVRYQKNSYQTTNLGTTIIDRGFFSGVVYNNDISLLRYYRDIVENVEVLHILVSCSENDYNKFLSIRGSEKDLSWTECAISTERYRICMKVSGAEYIEYLNIYDQDYGNISKNTCRGCSHYNNDKCCNPSSDYYQSYISQDAPRCDRYSDLEVQDTL